MAVKKNEHLCGRPSHNGICAVKLPKEIPHCPVHAVQVQRRNTNRYEFCSIYDVKIGDRII